MLYFIYHFLRLSMFPVSWVGHRKLRHNLCHRLWFASDYRVWSVTTEIKHGHAINELLRDLEKTLYGVELESRWKNDWVSVPKHWYIRIYARQKCEAIQNQKAGVV